MDSLQKRIEDDFIEAYKARDEKKSSLLRMIKSSLKNLAIEKKSDLSDSDIEKLLLKEIKQRREAADQYREGGREDLASKETSEIPMIEVYLPQQLNEDEIRDIVKSAISETGATSKADFGKVMGQVMPKVSGKADGTVVSKIVSSLLSND